MTVKDKLQDAKMLLQNERRIWFFGIFILVCIVVFMMTEDPKSKRRVGKAPEATDQTPMVMTDAYKDLIYSMQQDLKQLRSESQTQGQGVDRIKTDLDKNKQDSVRIFEQLLNEYDSLNDKVDTLGDKMKSKDSTTPAFQDDGRTNESGPGDLQPLLFTENNIPAPPKPPKHRKFTFISPGDAAPVVLLSGVNAPVDGTPYPVVFKLNGTIEGPDGSSLDLGEARVISAAQGSEVDGRVLFRLTNISVRHKNGRRSVVEVDGWVVGEDGIRGMKGKLIDKLPETLLAIGAATTASAAATNAFGGNSKTYSTSSDVNSSGVNVNSEGMENAIGKGFNKSTQKLVDVIIDRHEKLIPVVEVLSGREAVAVFSQPVEISPCEDDCENEDSYGSVD